MTWTQGAPATRADSLREALDSVFAAPAYRWEARSDPLSPLRQAWQAFRAWFERLGSESPTTLRVLTWVLVAALVAVFAHAAWVAVITLRAGKRPARNEAGAKPELRDAAWFRAEADRLAAAGRYVEAVQADFLRLALELDSRSVIRFHPSRTPNEYVRDASLSDERRRDLRELVRSLYAYAFARVPCDRGAFEAWRSRATAEHYARAG